MPDEDVRPGGCATVGDVVNGLGKIEEWVRALRTALQSIDSTTVLNVPDFPGFSPPQGGSAGNC